MVEQARDFCEVKAVLSVLYSKRTLLFKKQKVSAKDDKSEVGRWQGAQAVWGGEEKGR